MKSKAAIKKEIDELKRIRPLVVPHSMFGDDNLAKLDAAVEVLENNMDDSDIQDKEESEDWDSDTASAALDAYYWMTGQTNDKPSKGWPMKS